MAKERKRRRGTVTKPGKSPKPKAPAEKAVCFAIMPFGGWFDDYYVRVFKPAIEDAGMEPHRADDLFRPGSITNDIWAYTRRAKLVLADLTERNPNVFYELGLAHAISKPAILVVDDIDSVPFDLRNLRVIEYDKNDPSWGEQLRAAITKAIQETIAAPLTAVLPAFIEAKPDTKVPELGKHAKEVLDLRQQVDMLRREVRLGRARDVEGLRIGPEEAKAIIRDYHGRGMPLAEIVRRVSPLGPPPRWVTQEVEQLQTEPRIPERPAVSGPEKASAGA